tara:strand:- start:290 stop:1423 length:1134 start_codon:yes stop_codon:yes gene_type:complete
MTFGVNALDWTNIGRKLQTNMAETVGEALTSNNLPAFSSMVGFIIYDGETGAQLTRYDMYIDRDEVDDSNLDTTPIEYAVTTKENEDGEKIVIDRTLIPDFYIGADADGNVVITQDASSLEDTVDVDEDGNPVPLNAGAGGIQAHMGEEPIKQWANNLFDSIIDTDTGWSPNYGLTSSDGLTQFASVEELTNSDSTSWVRLKKRNGREEIYYFIPFDEYATLVDTIPATFTFTDGIEVYTAEPTENPIALASPVEETSLDSARLSSTYESTLTDLKTAYEALITPASTTSSTSSTTSSDGADTETSAFERAIASVQIWVSDNLVTPIGEYKYYILGGVGVLTFLYLYRKMSRKTASQPDTIGDMLDKALGSGKEVEG